MRPPDTVQPVWWGVIQTRWSFGFWIRSEQLGGVRHLPQSGWLSEWGRLKGGCPGYFIIVALKRASVHDPTCVPIHPLPLGRGCIGGLVQAHTRPLKPHTLGPIDVRL